MPKAGLRPAWNASPMNRTSQFLSATLRSFGRATAADFAHNRPPMRTYIVEDDAELRGALVNLLHQKGYHVEHSGRGREAQGANQRQAIHVRQTDVDNGQ